MPSGLRRAVLGREVLWRVFWKATVCVLFVRVESLDLDQIGLGNAPFEVWNETQIALVGGGTGPRGASPERDLRVAEKSFQDSNRDGDTSKLAYYATFGRSQKRVKGQRCGALALERVPVDPVARARERERMVSRAT